MKRVLIPTKLDVVAKEILESNGFQVAQDADTSLENLVASHSDAQALIVRSERVTAEIIDALPNLKVVVRAGSGYNTIDTKYARKRNVDVMNTPGANANAVAEEVVALVLAFYRHVVPADSSTRSGAWEKKKFMGREIAGKTLGIVGLGNIGQLVVKRLQGFDVTVLAYDPVISAARAEEVGARLVSLDELFSQADIVSLHIPENDETRGLINKDLLGRMKTGAVLVNCARAGIINEADLRAVKAEKRLGYCNDVYPKDAAGDKSIADVADIMLPHLGASTVEANRNAACRAAEQLIAYARRGQTTYVVNKGVPEGCTEQYQELAYQVGAIARHSLGVSKNISRIECSFYGELNPFGQWLLPPVVAGITPEFDAVNDPEEAVAYLKERGISFEIREVDENKSYGESMTADLFEGDKVIQRVSVRGTVAEGNPVVSRIDDFDKLYFQPKGHNLIAIYQDRPGVLAKITGACAEADLNIEDIRAPHDSTGSRTIAVLKTNRAVSKDVVEVIKGAIEAETVFAVSI